MAVISVPAQDVEVGEVVHTDHGWYPVTEKVFVDHQGISAVVLILDHPNHGTPVGRHLLGEMFRGCILSVPQHTKVSVQE